ncbi:MAG TPA: thiamine pyrophosphate-dependent enzyme [Anaerolineae bacterium]|nr:thiamine pyrophosphate-dependent enzyme [Anaerolineae bacterium]
METRIVTGNEAVALGALRAGVKVVTGYPGTPSTGALSHLLKMDLPGRHVEWSVNEKVALEIAAGVFWAGHRALCTMKMSGVNVAYDSLISIAYSGGKGALVIYVADDPGTNAGMCEQDSRGYALMSDLPMLEPSSVAEAYQLIQTAFELSDRIGGPVFTRLVTSLANSRSAIDVEDPVAPSDREALLDRDITKYTKAGAAICAAQHRDLIARLEEAGRIINEMGLNQLDLAKKPGGVGIVASGITAAYLEEGFEIAAPLGARQEDISVLRVAATNPFPAGQVQALLRHCGTILVLEELEPHVETRVYVEAFRVGFEGKIVGKLDGFFRRVGEYDVSHVVRGVAEALGLSIPEDMFEGRREAESLAAQRPITCCAGCPHRGTYLAIDKAIKKLGWKKDEVMVTGDIGCTILGMNPPFHTIWTEISMGASVGLAQGYVHSGIKTPVVATIGDSTFFHGGIPGLINAVQHQVPLTLIIMDNGWTAMTGMQVNPGTDVAFQPTGNRQVDIARLVPALGVESFFTIDPFDLEESTATIQKALMLPGVKVVLARQECAIRAMRRGDRAGHVTVLAENCNLCKLCITVTGCPAIGVGEDTIHIDPALCYGCGLCAEVCNREAIVEEQMV